MNLYMKQLQLQRFVSSSFHLAAVVVGVDFGRCRDQRKAGRPGFPLCHTRPEGPSLLTPYHKNGQLAIGLATTSQIDMGRLAYFFDFFSFSSFSFFAFFPFSGFSGPEASLFRFLSLFLSFSPFSLSLDSPVACWGAACFFRELTRSVCKNQTGCDLAC